MPSNETTLTQDEASGADRTAADFLFVVLHCDAPMVAPARYCLREVDVVELVRGADERQVQAAPRAGGGLRVELPDPSLAMAAHHAELVRAERSWTLVDRGARSGTRVNGEPVAQSALEDGDLIEVGGSFLVLRRELPLLGDGGARSPEGWGARDAMPQLATVVPSLEQDLARLAGVAASTTPVLVRGDGGAGKEELARAVHAMSRRSGAFVMVECARLSPANVEAELLGYVRGAFAGAVTGSAGLVRAADRGTLFLDELADLPPAAQAALLRVLHDGEVWPVGATTPARVSLRVVSATGRNLEQLVDEGRFRADLYQRLAGYTITLPPLKRRREDIGAIVATLLRRHAPRRAERVRFTRDAARAILRYPWPGNIDELERAVVAALAAAPDGQPIAVDHLPEPLLPYATGAVGPAAMEAARDAERKRRVLALMEQHEGNLSAVARTLGTSRTQVHRFLERYGIDLEQYRKKQARKKK